MQQYNVIGMLRKRKYMKHLAITAIFSMLLQILAPLGTYATSSGPGQPEYSSFKSAGTSDMVDPYTGDFNYNIPLLTVPGPNGGYPINLGYQSGVTMQQEASWVGLGWNLNVGAISRQMRGLPDDFAGDEIQQHFNLKENNTFSLSIPTSNERELMGFPVQSTESSGASIELYYNTLRGPGYRLSQNITSKRFQLGGQGSVWGLGSSLGVSYDSQGGLGISNSLSLETQFKAFSNVGMSRTINSRRGLESLTFSATSGGRASGLSSKFSFPLNHYVPSVSIPMKISPNPIELKFSDNIAFIGAVTYDQEFKWYGSIDVEKVAEKDISTPAYGYLNSHKARRTDLMDFNRKSISYSKKVPNLAPSMYTHDKFTVSGMGIGGDFRAYRSDVSILHDAESQSIVDGRRNSAEFGTGGGRFHIGYGYTNIDGIASSGLWWTGKDELGPVLQGAAQAAANQPEYEPAWFSFEGQQDVVYEDPGSGLGGDRLRQWKGNKALRPNVSKEGGFWRRDFVLQPELQKNSIQSAPDYTVLGNPANVKTARKSRASNIVNLSQDEAQAYGQSAGLAYNVHSSSPQQKFASPNPDFDHHISEINIHHANGMRYSYGLPAYNHKRKNASFRVGDADPITPQVAWEEHNISLVKDWHDGNQITEEETGGRDGFVSVQEVPGYAHSWLLTQLTSADYVDRGPAGPSAEDLGYWVKFNYDKAANNFKWRIPYTDANYQAGSLSDARDNLGSYSYGEKDLFYLRSIETKTHIAEFVTESRKDSYEPSAELNSQDDPVFQGSRSTKFLKSVKLYTKADYGNDLANPNPGRTPVKTVDFYYDYSLCSGIPSNIAFTGNTNYTLDSHEQSNTGGKLTLKEIHITHENSTRGKRHPYRFTYDSALNKAYNLRNVDRWGGFEDNTAYPTHYPFVNFPYTDQESSPLAAAWHLTKVEVPGGGEVNIEYEADDYAYVQDRKPMQMFDIRAMGPPISGQYNVISNSARDNSTIYYGFTNDKEYTGPARTHIGGDGDNFRIYFKLEKNCSTCNGLLEEKAFVMDNYLRDKKEAVLKKAYFDVEIDLRNDADKFDRVKGYAEVLTDEGPGDDFYGYDTYGGEQFGYITLKAEPMNKINIWQTKLHPFQLAAFQYLQLERQDLMYPDNFNAADPLSMIALINDARTLSRGFNRAAYNRFGNAAPYGTEVKLNGHSIIRLYSPEEGEGDGKYAGGVRVKRLAMKESGGSEEYGQVYDYTIEENGQTISSGVAYEPFIGGEESSLRQPIDYTLSTPMKARQSLFLEEPLLEELYPGAKVGYRQVTVRSLARAEKMTDDVNSTTLMPRRSATPVTIYNFYTPKEFPVVTDQSDLTNDQSIVRFSLIPGISSEFRKSKARTQGYSIQLNDMSGKPRKVTELVPANPLAPQSEDKILKSSEYIYHTASEFGDGKPNYLSNVVKTLNKDGTCQDAILGVSHDLYLDENEARDYRSSYGTDFNLEIDPAIYAFVPIPIPHFTESDLSFSTAVMNKVIYKTGIIKEIKNFDGQAYVKTENMRFDAESGAPLLTRVTNEFEDPIYALYFPGHWYYDGLKSDFRNLQAEFKDENQNGTLSSIGTVSNGTLSLSSNWAVENYFKAGDQLLLNNSAQLTVMEVSGSLFPNNPNSLRVIDPNGLLYGLNTTVNVTQLKIIESGYRNLSGIGVGNILAVNHPEGIDLETNPGSCINFIDKRDLKGVLQTHVSELSDEWGLNCSLGCDDLSNGNHNPYEIGLKGRWRQVHSYSWRDDRVNDSDIQKDGVYAHNWTIFPWADGTLAPSDRWQLGGTVTKYNAAGFESENVDALGNYSAVEYGYGNSLPTAVGRNTRLQDMVFDGFEDHALNTCADNHWDLLDNLNQAQISSEQAHTGAKSLALHSNGTVQTESFTLNLSGNPSGDLFSEDANGIVVNAAACNGRFNPTTGQDYVFSTWVKQSPKVDFYAINYEDPELELVVSNGNQNTVYNFSPEGKIVEGWQKMEGKIRVPANSTTIEFHFRHQGNQANSTVYFDDFRMHPFDANLVTYVYDPMSFRPLATLGPNNYAQYYIYNAGGGLIQTRIETENGIKTTSEGRSGSIVPQP